MTPKLAQRVAESIEREILTRERRVGESLGIESELLARYGISRSVLREAMVLVVGSGLAEVRRGKHGGLVVGAPSQDFVAAGLHGYLDFIVEGLDEIWAIRRGLEDLALGLAIERLQPDDLPVFDDLRDTLLQADDNRTKLIGGAAILRQITLTTRNPWLSVLILGLSRLAVERLGRGGGQARLLELAEDVAALRNEQMSAVVAADLGRALGANAQIFEIYEQMTLVAATTERRPEDAAPSPMFATPTKLGELTARRIRADIVTGELQPGDRLGSEPELMETYGVGRGVLREAIRILERLTAVEMVRGKNGGLRVCAPKPEGIVRGACAFLRALHVTPKHMQEVGEVLGLAAVDMAARNAPSVDPARTSRLIARLKGLEGATLRELSFAHYNVIGELSGSRALGLIMSIQANLYALDESPTADQVIVKEIVPERLRGLTEAVLSGDPDLARRRMMMLQRSGARVRIQPMSQLQSPQVLDVVRGPPQRDAEAEPAREPRTWSTVRDPAVRR